MKIFVLASLSLFLWNKSTAQYLWQFTDLVELQSVNEVDKALSKFGYVYENSDSVASLNATVVYFRRDDFPKGYSMIVGAYKADPIKKGMTIQVTTQSGALFNYYKKELEDYALTKLEKEEINGGSYVRTYTKTGCLYSFTATQSRERGNVYVIFITKINDYKLKLK